MIPVGQTTSYVGTGYHQSRVSAVTTMWVWGYMTSLILYTQARRQLDDNWVRIMSHDHKDSSLSMN